MNNLLKKLIHNLLIVFFILSCEPEKRWDCVKSTGKIITEDRILSPFKKLEIHDKIQTEIYLANEYSVKIEAGKNLMPKILTEVKDSCLIIKNLNRCNFMRDPSYKIKMKIFMPTLLSIHHYGYGDVYLMDTLQVDSVAFFNEGNGDIHLLINSKIVYGASYAAGDIYLKGSTHHFYYHFNGGNYLFAQDLWAKEYIYISSYSIGDAFVFTNSWLDGELRGTGNLYYKGNPEIFIKKITKGAKIIPIH